MSFFFFFPDFQLLSCLQFRIYAHIKAVKHLYYHGISYYKSVFDFTICATVHGRVIIILTVYTKELTRFIPKATTNLFEQNTAVKNQDEYIFICCQVCV